MSPQERKLATQSGAVLAREFTLWAKKKYKNQKPTFGEYLKDLASSKRWRDDWTSPANEVAGDWERNRGVVYKPGSRGQEVQETIGGPAP